MNTVARYASMVKFTHTIFAMPFALIGYVYALQSQQIDFQLLLLLKILLCMVLARNTAMGFNRWADRRIDAANPRTANREIPSGAISARAAALFVAANAIGFVAVTAFINPLALALSPVALIVIMGYSLTKRFTSWSHIVLGVSLAIAPVGAYIAVTGTIASMIPIILAGLVITWVGGFDILYSLQDAEFDRRNNLHSIPSRFSARTSVGISVALHCVTLYCVALIGLLTPLNGTIYWIGSAVFAVLLIMQHAIYTPSRIDRIGATFGLVNGAASVVYAIATIAAIVL